MSDVTAYEPTKFTAGDTVSWSVHDQEHLASAGWSVLYAFVREGTQKLVAASGQADGSHLVAISAGDSAAWPPGEYAWQKFAINSSVRHPLGEGRLVVAQNFVTATTGYDFRSTAEQMVALLDKAMKGRASKEELSSSIDTAQGSRAVSLLTPAQLSSEYFRWKAIWDDEKAQARRDKGLGSSKILFRIGGV